MANPNNPTIGQQIEASADYYPPGIYSGSADSATPPVSYLTYYNELVLNADSLADQYIPLSTVPQHGRNPKLFAIGVIAPSANITGRILDRSASVNSVAPIKPQDINAQTPSGQVSIVNRTASTDPKQQVPDHITHLSRDQVSQAFRDGFVQVTGQVPTDQVLALMLAQSDLETGTWNAIHNYNFGNIKGTNYGHLTTTYPASEVVNGVKTQFPAGVPQTNFRAYSSPSQGAADYIITLLQDNSRRNPPDAWKQALLAGDPEAFAEILSHPPPYYTGNKEAYAQGMRRCYDINFRQYSVSPDSYNGNWKQNGSANAAASSEMRDKLANTPLVSDKVAEQFTAAQKAQILATQAALEAMQNTPPLRMLVNPQSFSVKGEKIVSDGGWSRNGMTIVEHWGNQQEKISASGKVAGFYAIDAQNAVGPGLTRMARNFSQAWQNFQSLYLFYSNNGGLHTPDPTTNNTERNLSLVGSIYIYYDDILYIGAFDSLNVTETDTAPHTVDYSFEFTVRAAFLLDNPSQNAQGAARQASSSTPGAIISR